jgi:hypothetical protein
MSIYESAWKGGYRNKVKKNLWFEKVSVVAKMKRNYKLNSISFLNAYNETFSMFS